MIHIDKKTLTQWQEKGISNISCHLQHGGCAGNTVYIDTEVKIGEEVLSIAESDILCYTDQATKAIIENASITYNGKNWIVSSKNILTHCGCGKSFSISTGDLKKDKILLLKSKLKKKHHHT